MTSEADFKRPTGRFQISWKKVGRRRLRRRRWRRAAAEAEEVAEVEAEAEATSSTSPEVGADAGAERGRQRRRFLFFFFLTFGWLKNLLLLKNLLNCANSPAKLRGRPHVQ